MARLRGLLPAILCLWSLSAGRTNALARHAADFKLFRFIPELRRYTTVPIRLPAYLPNLGSILYAELSSVSADDYLFRFSRIPNCGGVRECNGGELSGERITRKTLPIVGRPVSLEDGRLAFYFEPPCDPRALTCPDSTLSFDVRGFRYAIGLKGGTLAEERRMADSFRLVDAGSDGST
jgi:hypothetical protein